MLLARELDSVLGEGVYHAFPPFMCEMPFPNPKCDQMLQDCAELFAARLSNKDAQDRDPKTWKPIVIPQERDIKSHPTKGYQN